MKVISVRTAWHLFVVALLVAAEEESFADGGPKAQAAGRSGRRAQGKAAREDFNGVPRIALGT